MVLPGAELAFQDPGTGEGDTYTAGDEEVSGPLAPRCLSHHSIELELGGGESHLRDLAERIRGADRGRRADGHLSARLAEPSCWPAVQPVSRTGAEPDADAAGGDHYDGPIRRGPG